ncbi:MAG: D-hexose-6-phosphate mutarotase [Hyphomicrobiaceae bacterium]
MPVIDELNSDFGRPGRIMFAMGDLGGPQAHLHAGDQSAIVALQGAQVLSWQSGGRERLWLSPVSRLGSSKPVRGGIPVCWPWFGPATDDSSKPAHGFVRTRNWNVVQTQIAADQAKVAVTLAFATGPEHAALWPYDAKVRLTVSLDTGLSLTLETFNKGAGPLVLGEALHTYFAVSDIATTAIDGFDGTTYIDKLDRETVHQQSGPIIIAGEVDRIYLGDTGPVTLRDGIDQIIIASKGSASTVVWNPWANKTLRLGDMGAADAFRHMVCIETANAASDIVMLPPGGRHVLEARYTATPAKSPRITRT